MPPTTQTSGFGDALNAGVHPTSAATDDARHAILEELHAQRTPLAHDMDGATSEPARRALRDRLHNLDSGFLRRLAEFPPDHRYEHPDRAVVASVEAALQLKAVYAAETRLGDDEGGRRDAAHGLGGMAPASQDNPGGEEWCGAFANAEHQRAGLSPRLARAFMATGNVEDFFRYHHNARNPAFLFADGAWQQVRAYHAARHAERKWFSSGHVQDATPLPGDIVTVDIRDGAGADHIMMVHTFNSSNRQAVLIDGNGRALTIDHHPHASDVAAPGSDREVAEPAIGGHPLHESGSGSVTVSTRHMGSQPSAAAVQDDVASAARAPHRPGTQYGPRQVHRIYGIGRLSAVDYEEHRYSQTGREDRRPRSR
jgi:hypothetical protein